MKLKVYECHVGISSSEAKVNSYNDFAESVLPRIAELGYNAIQVNSLCSISYLKSLFKPATNHQTTISKNCINL